MDEIQAFVAAMVEVLRTPYVAGVVGAAEVWLAALVEAAVAGIVVMAKAAKWLCAGAGVGVGVGVRLLAGFA